MTTLRVPASLVHMPTRMLSILSLILLIGGWGTSSSASDFHAARAAVEADLSVFHLDHAVEKIHTLNSPGYEAFYHATVLIYKFASTQNIVYLDNLRDTWKETLSTIEDLPNTDPLRDVMLAELYCKRGGLEFMDQNYLTAIRLVRNGRQAIKRNRNNFPDNVEQKKLLGLFNVTFGAVPRKYQWITHTLGFRGDIREGLKQLEEASRYGSLLRLESKFLVYYVEKNMLEQTEKALAIIEAEKAQTPDNILLDYILASGYISLKKNDRALQILDQRKRYQAEAVFFIPFWDYLAGKANYYKENHARAQHFFSQFLQAYKGKLYRTDATFRLGMSLTLDGNYPAGQRFFKLITDHEGSGFEEDNYAGFMADKFLKQSPNPRVLTLFRARNLYDGGYYDQAITHLKSLEKKTAQLDADERTELHYRYGRVYQGMKQTKKAVTHYQACTLEKPTYQLWLQPYAYFYMGQLAAKADQFEQARNHFKKALDFNGYFYQEGLENRCKIALYDVKKL